MASSELAIKLMFRRGKQKMLEDEIKELTDKISKLRKKQKRASPLEKGIFVLTEQYLTANLAQMRAKIADLEQYYNSVGL